MPHYVTIEQAIKERGVSRATLYRWIKFGYLTRYNLPGYEKRTHIDLDQLDELRKNPPMRPKE